MAFLYNKLSRKIVSTLILSWGLGSFLLLNLSSFTKILILILSLLVVLFIWYEIFPIAVLISLSFLSSYSFYGYLYQFNLPNWLIMIAILFIFGYLFLYTEQKIGILGNRRLIYLVLFSLITLEVFLSLAFFLINPLGKSLIISIVSYVFIGFCYSVLAKQKNNKISTYVYFALASTVLIFLSSGWGGSV